MDHVALLGDLGRKKQKSGYVTTVEPSTLRLFFGLQVVDMFRAASNPVSSGGRVRQSICFTIFSWRIQQKRTEVRHLCLRGDHRHKANSWRKWDFWNNELSNSSLLYSFALGHKISGCLGWVAFQGTPVVSRLAGKEARPMTSNNLAEPWAGRITAVRKSSPVRKIFNFGGSLKLLGGWKLEVFCSKGFE